jgi:NadR type nicotinamide-nucleotide adenylyltransferase
MNKVRKIALLGPESTGKTALGIQLAAHFKTVCVPEFARNYLLERNNQYTFEDVEHCVKQQLALENEMENSAKHFLFCDTELINFKVWFKDVFDKVPETLEAQIKSHRYDLTLLTYPDVPFEKDILRANENRRQYFFDWYQRELEAYQHSYIIIKGLGENRFNEALTVINSWSTTIK